MKKLLNTLYVTTQGLYLHQEGETVTVSKAGKTLQRIPIHMLSGIVCFGNVLCSPFLLGLCAERGVHVSFLAESGRFLARVLPPVCGNVLLRVEQTKASLDVSRKAQLARSFVAGKVLNARNVLQRRLRDHGPDEGCDAAIATMANVVQRLRSAEDVDVVRGLEGEAASAYFGAFNTLIVAQRETFLIENRNRRPPRDPMNALLSFLYTLLAHDCEGALEGVGLDPQIGFLHALRPGRPSLALDLMEELRAALADRMALTLVNRQQVSLRSFQTSESGAVLMTDTARKEVILAWQNRKKEEVVHPFLEEKVPYGLIPHLQAQLLAKHLRGELDAYPPFLLK